MKTTERNDKAVKHIMEILTGNKHLLQPAGYSCNRKPVQKATFPIGDNDELMYNISCLLKTCILALEGEAAFSSSAISNADPKASIIVALEFIINLLPREQMLCLDKISGILNELETDKPHSYESK